MNAKATDEPVPPVPVPPVPVLPVPVLSVPVISAPAKAAPAKAAPAKAAPAPAALANAASAPAIPPATTANPYAQSPNQQPQAQAIVNQQPQAQPIVNQQPPYPQAAYSPAAAGPPQGLAISSMVLGIVGLVFLGILASIPAVITGHMAQKRQPYAKAFWLTGLITGYIGILIGVVLVVLAVVWFVVIFSIAAASGTSSF